MDFCSPNPLRVQVQPPPPSSRSQASVRMPLLRGLNLVMSICSAGISIFGQKFIEPGRVSIKLNFESFPYLTLSKEKKSGLLKICCVTSFIDDLLTVIISCSDRFFVFDTFESLLPQPDLSLRLTLMVVQSHRQIFTRFINCQKKLHFASVCIKRIGKAFEQWFSTLGIWKPTKQNKT